MSSARDLAALRRHGGLLVGAERGLLIEGLAHAAREPVAWGRTASVLTPENLLTARRMCEAFDQDAALCADEQTPSLPPRGEVVRAVNPVREHGVPTRD